MRFFGWVFVCVLASCVCPPCWAQNDAISEAVAALERGDLANAEQTLQAVLKARPNDAAALGVLGVVLDQEKKYREADGIYRRALAVSPRSAALLNNYGNHLVATGKSSEARKVFVQVLALNPGQPNALVQLARLALERKSSSEALSYLERLRSEERRVGKEGR